MSQWMRGKWLNLASAQEGIRRAHIQPVPKEGVPMPKDEYGVITGPHVSECPKKLVNCPNELCSVSLERCCVPRHVQQSCDYTEVYYASMGCGMKKIRMDMEEHEGSTEHHFPIAMKKITELNIIMSRGTSTSWSTDNTGPRTIFI